MNALRLYHTLKHLKRVQITNRIWRKLSPPRFDWVAAPALRTQHPLSSLTASRPPSLLGPDRIRVFQQTILVDRSTWNDHKLSHLVLYNLHYFDDLAADNASERREWHASLMDRWIEENPPGCGAGWEPYPLSLRIVNWIKWALAGNTLSPRQLASLAPQAAALPKLLEYHLLANHLFANAKAMVFAGAFFSGDLAEAWLKQGCELLQGEIAEQILSDGGHFELSPMYHSIILEDMLDLTRLSQVYPDAQPLQMMRGKADTIQAMRRWLSVMTHPDQQIAFFNDAAFEIAAAPHALHDYAARLGLADVPSHFAGLTYLADTGYLRLERDDAVVLIDAAEIGPDYQPGHAHADTLSFEWSLGPQRIVVNSGTSCYGISAERHRQRATAAHSTVEVDGQDSSEVWSGFRVARRAHVYDVRVDENAQRISVSAAHDGYRRLPARIRHLRRWVLETGQMRVHDQLVGNPCAAIARFHLHPQLVLLPTSRRLQQSLQAPDNRRIEIEVEQGDLSRVTSTYHPRFDVALATHMLVSRCLSGEHDWTARW